MTDKLTCPECGRSEFRRYAYVSIYTNGEVCDESEDGAYVCVNCDWELSDDDGSPITDADEIVVKMHGYTCIYVESISTYCDPPGYLDDDWDLTDDEIDEWTEIADQIIADELSEQLFGLPVHFGTDYELSQEINAGVIGKPLFLDSEDWHEKCNDIYCDAAQNAYEAIIKARQEEM